MYLKHFNLEHPPFALTPETDFYCALPSHQACWQTILFSLQQGEGFVLISGEVGTGKTLLCRKLIGYLSSKDQTNDDERYLFAYIPNPTLNPQELKIALAYELGLSSDHEKNTHRLLHDIQQHLIKMHQEGFKVILVIDEAQVLPDESLETLRLLTNLETEHSKLLQVVLFSQPELLQRLNRHHLRQLKQRITFSAQLQALDPQDLRFYLHHRLSVSGFKGQEIFSKYAQMFLCRYTKGIPRRVNTLCHKALMLAYGRGHHFVNLKTMYEAACDDRSLRFSKKFPILLSVSLLCTTIFFSKIFIMAIGY